MSESTKVFITVKTYPTISQKYDELVCTAGITEDGSWVRMYPIPFRKLEYEKQYPKYHWVEAPLERNTSDVRPESFRVTDLSKFKVLNKVGTEDGWQKRKNIIFKKQKAYTNLTDLIKRASNNELSIATFKPSKIVDLKTEATSREWTKEKLDLLRAKSQQLSMFQTPEEVEREFKVVEKVPYKFSYTFLDDSSRESTLMIEDWEIGALYWKCLNDTGKDEKAALDKVKQKYITEFSRRDIYLFLGTTKKYHGWAKNPFVIIGVFYPPVNIQTSLDLG